MDKEMKVLLENGIIGHIYTRMTEEQIIGQPIKTVICDKNGYEICTEWKVVKVFSVK